MCGPIFSPVIHAEGGLILLLTSGRHVGVSTEHSAPSVRLYARTLRFSGGNGEESEGEETCKQVDVAIHPKVT